MQILITKYTLVLYTMHSRHCKGVQEQIVSEAILCVSWGGGGVQSPILLLYSTT